jgi:hypothetical protein
MKKILTYFIVLAFFVPCVSFAQTTQPVTYSPQYVALLEQLVKLLEQELASIQSSASTATQSVITSAVPASPTVTVTVAPASIQYDATTTLTWIAYGAASCALNSSPTLLASTGSEIVTPTNPNADWTNTNTTSYTVTCTGTGGSASGSATVSVQPWIPPAGYKVLQECSFATAPCTTGPHGEFCYQGGCGG